MIATWKSTHDQHTSIYHTTSLEIYSESADVKRRGKLTCKIVPLRPQTTTSLSARIFPQAIYIIPGKLQIASTYKNGKI